jgi:hypothetical protein
MLLKMFRVKWPPRVMRELKSAPDAEIVNWQKYGRPN